MQLLSTIGDLGLAVISAVAVSAPPSADATTPIILDPPQRPRPRDEPEPAPGPAPVPSKDPGPEDSKPETPATAPAPAPTGDGHGHGHDHDPTLENDEGWAESEDEVDETAGGARVIVVHDEEKPRDLDRGASHFRLDRDLLEAAPRQGGAEMLNSAPGVFVARSEGGAVAHRYVLRGFDADHGQDIEMRVGGLPINLPSHIHGQGYSDLSFLIPEVVDDLHVSEGVYDPRQGDFAVAGSFDIHLAVHRRGWRVASGFGAFNTFRQLALWAPREAPEQTFGAVQYSRSDGFGQNRRGQSGSGIVQAQIGRDDGRWDHRVLGILHAARYEHAGVLRVDDIEAGNVDYHGVYDHPTARGQDASSARILVGEFSHYHGPRGENAETGVWMGYDSFRIDQNFTGFQETSMTLENVSGRGDLIQQQNRTLSGGIIGRYRSRRYRLARWAHGTFEFGTDGRFDRIDQQQGLIDASVRNQIWDERVDAQIHGVDLGLFGDLDWWLSDYVRVRLGARADALFYDVEDRLGNFVPASRPEDSFLPGFRRSASGLAAGPRTSVEVRPLGWLSVRGAYGEGYRSPQARTLEDGELAPFTKVRSADLGLRFTKNEQHQLTIAGYWTRLSDDVAFDADEGRLERVGASQRLGTVVHAQTRPVPWVIGAVSFTFVDAELLEPPPATAEDPQPAFEAGQNLPFVPPIVVRADLGIRGPLALEGTAREVTGRIGAGVSYLSPRPLPHGSFADPVPLLDASAGLGFGPVDLDLSMFNLLNRRYAAAEYSFASHWDPDAARPRTPTRHLSAGAPFSFMLTLGLSL